MRGIALAVLAAAAALAIGCGGDSGNGNEEATSEAATKSEDAVKSGGKMKDGEAMKEDAAMKDGAAMKEDAAMKEEAAMTSNRRRKGKVVKVVGSQYGKVIADGKGEAFYLFDKESSKRSRCYGACARAWPPVLTKGRPRAGKGTKARLLGTTRRRNGKLQVTYANRPLYYYVDDSPGTILCQNVAEFGGLWLVVKPNGRAVR